jgi:hypothetical protein
MKLLRTIRLDPSDTFVFETAAEPGEWAVTGSFLFIGEEPSTLSGKRRAAFRSGFVGARSLGFSTLAVVTDARPEDMEEAVAQLAGNLVEVLGAPDMAAALAAAQEEVEFAAGLASHPTGTLVALHRSVEDGEIRERFRVLMERDRNVGGDGLHSHSRAFVVVEEDGDDGPEERVDLIGMVRGGGS